MKSRKALFLPHLNRLTVVNITIFYSFSRGEASESQRVPESPSTTTNQPPTTNRATDDSSVLCYCMSFLRSFITAARVYLEAEGTSSPPLSSARAGGSGGACGFPLRRDAPPPCSSATTTSCKPIAASGTRITRSCNQRGRRFKTSSSQRFRLARTAYSTHHGNAPVLHTFLALTIPPPPQPAQIESKKQQKIYR